jgi:PAS domain S-box-containing protein
MSTQIATLFLDGSLRIKFFTPTTRRVLKLIEADMGRPVSDLSTGFLDFDLTIGARAVAVGGPVIERDVRHASGAVFHLRILPYLTPENRAEGVVVTLEDVSLLRQAEERMRRLATVVSDSNDAVILADLHGAIQAWNRGAEATYGWTEPEALRMNLHDLTPAPDAARMDELIRRLLAGEDIASCETQRHTKDGRVLAVWLTITAVLDQAREIVAIATTERDITQRKQAEASLRRGAEELQRSNRDLQQFAGTVSHDLQEPLRMVSGFLKLLDAKYKPQLDDQARQYINYAVEGAARMAQMISGLLDYSRVSDHGAKLEPVDCSQALATALANLRGSVAEAGAAVTHDDLPTVMADPIQLAQLFQNLLGNALKFRHADRPCQVHVSAEKKDDQWVFAVRDNGIGIAPQDAQRLFEIFTRLNPREEYPGTGIGLAICRRIIERHGGRIWVEGEAGQGSTFYFTLRGRG